MSTTEKLQALVSKGANIQQVESNKYIVYDNGFWGFVNHESPFYISDDDILELYNEYIQ